MNKKLIFLSHIHEESEMAGLIQMAIEEEFAGFVKVFVSSLGDSIPAGANVLKRIESGLIECVAAIYLISPESIKRSWINFELGAIWIRSCVSQNTGGPEIPALPFCHSDMTFALLPQPISNLNAIEASKSASLESAFRSIQIALGVSGVKLRTDFNNLAKKISELEEKYTINTKLQRAFTILGRRPNPAKVKQGAPGKFHIELGFIEQAKFDQAAPLIPNPLKNDIQIKMLEGSGVYTFENGRSVLGGPTDIILTEAGLLALRKHL